MRWLSFYDFENDFLELGEGEFVYYQERPIGPGILLSDEERTRYLFYSNLIWWAIPAAFVFPNRWVVARLSPFESGSFMAEVSEYALPLCLFVLILWAAIHKAEGYLKRVGKPRSLEFCEEDNRRFLDQDAEREGRSWMILRGCGVLTLAILLGALLDALLLRFL